MHPNFVEHYTGQREFLSTADAWAGILESRAVLLTIDDRITASRKAVAMARRMLTLQKYRLWTNARVESWGIDHWVLAAPVVSVVSILAGTVGCLFGWPAVLNSSLAMVPATYLLVQTPNFFASPATQKRQTLALMNRLAMSQQALTDILRCKADTRERAERASGCYKTLELAEAAAADQDG